MSHRHIYLQHLCLSLPVNMVIIKCHILRIIKIHMDIIDNCAVIEYTTVRKTLFESIESG